MHDIRRRAASSRKDADEMLSRLPKHVQHVLSSCGRINKVNLILLKELGDKYYPEGIDELIRDLKQGFPLVGDIPVEKRAKKGKCKNIDLGLAELRRRSTGICKATLKKKPGHELSREDLSNIIQQTSDEIELGRMTPFKEPDIHGEFPFTRRFAVKQLSGKGGWKLRCIDDYLRSEINDATGVDGTIPMGKLSDLLGSAAILSQSKTAQSAKGDNLVIIKSDFRAAYRSCPILTEHLGLTRIVVWDADQGRYIETSHNAMPFGALAAVYAWDRLGAALQAILSRALTAPINRYVDDLFTISYNKGSDELREFIVEIIDLLGFTLDWDKTPPPAGEQTILGVRVAIRRNKVRGVQHYKADLSVDECKAINWSKQLQEVLSSGTLSCKLAQKFAGRLNFIAYSILGPLGSSKLRHIYTASYRNRDVELSDDLREELVWWLSYLKHLPKSTIKIWPLQDGVPILYTDAEGYGGLGAVSILSNSTLWFRTNVESIARRQLAPRKTQIIAYEMLAALQGLSRFCQDFANRDVILFIDNMSAKGSIRKGKCKKDDLQAIVDDVILLAQRHSIRIHPFWVPSSLNISDIPSRGDALPFGKEVSL